VLLCEPTKPSQKGAPQGVVDGAVMVAEKIGLQSLDH
jgi:hypothetical protein